MDFRVVNGCPCPASIAPYIYLVLRRAGQTATSIYRGDDARNLLHAHGRHTQRELYNDPAYAGKANPPGQSQHELRSDGNANPGPVGRHLEEWEIGIDSGADTVAAKNAITRAAQHYGWTVRHPYSRGVEIHHWCFADRPHGRSWPQRARLIHIKAVLPRR